MKALLYAAGALVLILVLTVIFRPPPPFAADYYNEDLDPARAPVQEETDEEVFPIRVSHGTMMLTPLASYDITAVVLSKKRYYFGWSAEVAPYDFALGWKGMAKENTRKTVHIRQRSRWYYFQVKGESPYTLGYISRNSANTHVIPATENLRWALRRVKKDDYIRLSGFLVKARGFIRGREVFWNSSISRTDTGDGACEVLYAFRLYHEGKIYE
ncbi:hypothetical protein JXR74_03100 [Candidatus Mcinerneyibacteriota bacterium]|nr:hypothetical protein [Candidatus Mcinerneyibacteriota bacterium]